MDSKTNEFDSLNGWEFGEETEEMRKEAVVRTLYKALALGDSVAVEKIIAEDLEWWFHGPPGCQHMMRVLTGGSDISEFEFRPRRVTPIGDCVIAEGWEGDTSYWVHVWTVKDGVIVQFREYFNTCLTVRDMRPPLRWAEARHASSTLWQSQPRNLSDQSLPGLLLAI
ncbi:hypothetical protein MLD38_029974 [Melastoma candidum]|uniref:Uncharacterized protein n=1 Tax=Melastoma candidum TaxID=119954 RepID=A0ACB9MKB5_9MYRT|nr:hypothetical protein MLD38_029974 [Melastoma candidum]